MYFSFFFFFFFHGDEFLLSFAGRVLNLVKIGFESSERFEDIKIIFRTNVFNIRFSENWDLFIFFFLFFVFSFDRFGECIVS